MLSINKEVKLENQAESSPTVHKGWFNPRTAVSNGYPVSLEKKKFKLNFLVCYIRMDIVRFVF